jgi:hypothetical protein
MYEINIKEKTLILKSLTEEKQINVIGENMRNIYGK